LMVMATVFFRPSMVNCPKLAIRIKDLCILLCDNNNKCNEFLCDCGHLINVHVHVHCHQQQHTRTSLHLQWNVPARAVPPIANSKVVAVCHPTPRSPACHCWCAGCTRARAALMVMTTGFLQSPHLCLTSPKVGDSMHAFPRSAI
jgi:hypothetical protein